MLRHLTTKTGSLPYSPGKMTYLLRRRDRYAASAQPVKTTQGMLSYSGSGPRIYYEKHVENVDLIGARLAR